MADQVICRSDHAYIGYPLAFYWQEQRLKVDEVLAEYRSIDVFVFRVCNEKSGIFELTYNIDADEWSVQQL